MAKMMIVDASPFTRGILKFILEQAKHQVIGISDDVREAIKTYLSYQPAVLFCDISSKENTGMLIVRAIMEADSNARIVVTTVPGIELRIDEAQKVGAVGHLQKPYTVVAVDRAISSAL